MNAARPVVYLVDPSPAVTGAFVCACQMADVLASRADVTLVVDANADLPADDLARFAMVRRLPLARLRRTPGAMLGYLPALWRSSRRLARWLEEDRAATVIFNDFYLLEGWAIRRRGYRGRILTWVRMDPANLGTMGRLWLRAARAASDEMIAVSRFISDLLPRGFTDRVIYDAVPQAIVDAEPRPDDGGRGQTFVYVGNYIEGKGQDIAIEALALIADRYPQTRIAFLGGDMGLAKNRDYRARLERRAASLGVAAQCSFAPPSRDLPDLLPGHVAALNFSRSESFSMTVLEASGCGLPVIATRSGGPQEILIDGKTGLLLPERTPDAVARAMAALLDDPAAAARMGKRGREHVLTAFSPDKFADEIAECVVPAGESV